MRFSNGCRLAAVFILAAAVMAGCMGVLNSHKSLKPSAQAALNAPFAPDNCTKCHLAWSENFDYYRGWDRYGYFFPVKGDSTLTGWFDTWSAPVENMSMMWYATSWWESPELNPWPKDIADKPMSYSVLSKESGLPAIPKAPSDVKGKTIVVDKTGGDYKTIGEAVAKAAAGTTVFVMPGEYNEVVVLKDGVSLVGKDATTTIINPKNQGHAVTAANHSLIAGFTITGTGIVYDTKKFNCGVYVSGCDSTSVIMGNIFRENGLFGVWIDGAPDEAANLDFDKKLGLRMVEINDRPYKDYPNPIIAGNTFYRIGQRGVFCVHARGEVFNNYFVGNVKAMGLERHSRPLVHHNIFYYNNIPMAINRSEPAVFNNIFYKNQWGQRMIRGANPVIFGNVTFESPFFRDFDEDGIPIPYTPHPGTGEKSFDPLFNDPLNCDFSYKEGSPFSKQSITSFSAAGVMRDSDLPQPFALHCKDSFGREVLSMTPEISDLIKKIETENSRVKTLSASYTVNYLGYLDVSSKTSGGPLDRVLSSTPVIRINYRVSDFSLNGNKRVKTYNEARYIKAKKTTDSGKITYNGSYIEAEGGKYASIFNSKPDPLYVGDRPFRETPGSFYRDYDQYFRGCSGPIGTTVSGYLHILGGKILPDKAKVNGASCIVVRYPHIGKDQYFLFYLDPAIGYRPRMTEEFYNEKLCRTIDYSSFKKFAGDISLPVKVKVTDYMFDGPNVGEKAASWELLVDTASVRVNGK